MSNWTGFGSLNLATVAAEGGGRLRPGSYVCRVKSAAIEDTQTGGKKLVVEFEDQGGAGTIRENINVHNKSPQATEIGLRRLKALLVCGGHSNPDRPGDVKSLVGLVVGVHVEAEEYEDRQTGEKRQGSKVRDRGAFFVPGADGAPAVTAAGVPTSSEKSLHDDIPF